MGGEQRLQGADCVREGSTLDFCSLTMPHGRPSRPAWSAGLLALCLAWPWQGPAGPNRGPIPTFRHFREKLMTASVPWTSSSSTGPAPLACPERPLEQRRPWLPSCLHGCVYWSLLQLSGLQPLVFQNRNKYPDSSFIKMEFCCKEKCYPNSTGSGGKAALRYAEKVAQGRRTQFSAELTA